MNEAFAACYDKGRSRKGLFEPDIDGLDFDDYDFLAGHWGFTEVAQMGGRIICVLRDPIDRFLSVYFYWRQLYEKEGRRERGMVLAEHLPLAEFAERFDELPLIEEFFNRMTWQLAHSHHISRRKEMPTRMASAELLEMALDNLAKCEVVGFQHDMASFAARCSQLVGQPLLFGNHNSTKKRAPVSDLSPALRRRIEDWLPLDIQLYQAALRAYGSKSD